MDIQTFDLHEVIAILEEDGRLTIIPKALGKIPDGANVRYRGTAFVSRDITDDEKYSLFSRVNNIRYYEDLGY